MPRDASLRGTERLNIAIGERKFDETTSNTELRNKHHFYYSIRYYISLSSLNLFNTGTHFHMYPAYYMSILYSYRNSSGGLK